MPKIPTYMRYYQYKFMCKSFIKKLTLTGLILLTTYVFINSVVKFENYYYEDLVKNADNQDSTFENNRVINKNNVENGNSFSSSVKENVVNDRLNGNDGNLSDENFLLRWDAEIRRRNEISKKACNEFLGSSNWNADHVGVFRHGKSHLAHCGHGKVASSTWIGLFYMLANETVPRQNDLHAQGWNRFKPEKNEKLKFDNLFMVTSVRHPYTRLVSSYRDRSFKHVIGNMVPSHSRDLEKWQILQDEIGYLRGSFEDSPTFSEYISYIASEYEKCDHANIACMFKMNPHWRSYYPKCSSCVLPYHMISKIETFSEDIRYIRLKLKELQENEDKEQLELTERVLTQLEKGLTLNKSKGKGSTKFFAEKLFELLTPEENDRLRSIFKVDLAMFDYDPYLYNTQS